MSEEQSGPPLTVSYPDEVKASARPQAHAVELVTPVDPVIRQMRAAVQVDQAWMTQRDHVPMVQRIGFGVISLFWLGGAVFFISMAADELHQDYRASLFLTSPALFFGYMGVRGLRNVFPSSSTRPGLADDTSDDEDEV